MRRGSCLLGALLLAGCATTPRPEAAVAPAAPTVPKTYQWLHGSGEAAVLHATTYRAMVRYALAQLAARKAGRAIDSAVLTDGATPANPHWVSCDTKPPAVVFDMDETAILNTGANYDSARRGDPPFDAARWDAWERTGAADVEPLPGAQAGLAALRAAGITPIFISNRQRANASATLAALNSAALGPAAPGDTLFLQGDVAPGAGKDPRRAVVAARWCVLAMAGDQLGDFSDLFNAKALTVQARRQLAQSSGVADRWGAGWFLLPNPAYGPGVAGSLDDLFPADKRWTPPAETK